MVAPPLAFGSDVHSLRSKPSRASVQDAGAMVIWGATRGPVDVGAGDSDGVGDPFAVPEEPGVLAT
jgi:hypothetical protein